MISTFFVCTRLCPLFEVMGTNLSKEPEKGWGLGVKMSFNGCSRIVACEVDSARGSIRCFRAREFGSPIVPVVRYCRVKGIASGEIGDPCGGYSSLPVIA
jgi:hypothetical protein